MPEAERKPHNQSNARKSRLLPIELSAKARGAVNKVFETWRQKTLARRLTPADIMSAGTQVLFTCTLSVK